jgi:hypothetical protein
LYPSTQTIRPPTAHPHKKEPGLKYPEWIPPPPSPSNLLGTEGQLQPHTAQHYQPQEEGQYLDSKWKEVPRGLIELGGNLLLSTMKKEF